MIDPPKSPDGYSWLTYLWVLGLSTFAGLVAFLQKIRDRRAHTWTIFELISEVAISAFVGLVTFYICEANGIFGGWQAANVGISAHMGTRGLKLLQGISRVPKDK